jgi:hypothetical protein
MGIEQSSRLRDGNPVRHRLGGDGPCGYDGTDGGVDDDGDDKSISDGALKSSSRGVPWWDMQHIVWHYITRIHLLNISNEEADTLLHCSPRVQ